MGRLEDGFMHLQFAQELSEKKDYFGARVEFLKTVESFKQAGAISELELATTQYEKFVRNDPIFHLLVSVLSYGIKQNPGILQSEITNKASDGNWADVYNYDRPILKDDVYYALYFADKFGLIKRIKKGRSYELFINNEVGGINNDNK